MIDEKKIILMTKLSICEKEGLRKDLEITKYYPEDYVYMNNIKTIIGVLAVSVLFAMVHVVLSWQEEMLIPTSGEQLLHFYVLPYGSVIVGVLILYTLLSTRIYLKKYEIAKNNIKRYKEFLSELDKTDLEMEIERGNYRGKRGIFIDQRETRYTL